MSPGYNTDSAPRLVLRLRLQILLKHRQCQSLPTIGSHRFLPRRGTMATSAAVEPSYYNVGWSSTNNQLHSPRTGQRLLL